MEHDASAGPIKNQPIQDNIHKLRKNIVLKCNVWKEYNIQDWPNPKVAKARALNLCDYIQFFTYMFSLNFKQYRGHEANPKYIWS